MSHRDSVNGVEKLYILLTASTYHMYERERVYFRMDIKGKKKELTINTLSFPPTSANVTPDV